jgi:hypothetical protein
MAKRKILILPIFLIFFLSNCTFENEEEFFVQDTCDTTGITYDSLTYIFSGICANCHNSDFTYRDGIVMDSLEKVRASINTGLVWKAINHEEGVSNMPRGLPKLSDCELKKIRAWIDAGMPE